jgi:hypothetical protein
MHQAPLDIIIDFKNKTVSWEDTYIAMCDFFVNAKAYRELHTIVLVQQSMEPPSVKEQTGSNGCILNANYEAADLQITCLENVAYCVKY